MAVTHADELWEVRDAALRCLRAVKRLLWASKASSSRHVGKMIRKSVGALYSALKKGSPQMDDVFCSLLETRPHWDEWECRLTVLTQKGQNLVQHDTAHAVAFELGAKILNIVWKAVDFETYDAGLTGDLKNGNEQDHPVLNLDRVEANYEAAVEAINVLGLRSPGWLWMQVQREWALATKEEHRAAWSRTPC